MLQITLLHDFLSLNLFSDSTTEYPLRLCVLTWLFNEKHNKTRKNELRLICLVEHAKRQMAQNDKCPKNYSYLSWKHHMTTMTMTI